MINPSGKNHYPMKHLYGLVNAVPKEYEEDCLQFCHWLRTALNSELHLTYKRGFYDEIEVLKLPYIVRFTEAYAKRVQAKFYALEKYWKDAGITRVTMATLTSYQVGETSIKACGGRTIEEAFKALKKAMDLIRKRLHYHLPGVQYHWVYEPHISGYPHVHLIIVGEVPEHLQERLKRLYSQKWNIGDEEHGLHFKEIEMKSVRNYVLKYINKSLNTTNSKHEKPFNWTPGQLVYYSLMRKNSYRFWGSTAKLTEVMRYHPEESGIYPVKLELVNGLSSAVDEPIEIWQNPLSYGEFWAGSLGGLDPPLSF